jgi:endonuclease/exonuclease/phosphatase family metal-dependent hydrolase
MIGISVCTYNVMLPVPEPIRFNGQSKRTESIPLALSKMSTSYGGIDVFVITELISKRARKIMITKMKQLGWRFCSAVLRAPTLISPLKIADGGVVVFSKYPIVYQHSHVFEDACTGYDCSASKGAIFCRIQKGRYMVWVVGLHLQAWNTFQCDGIRSIQINQCMSVVKALNIPFCEPVIYAGDFNVDWYTQTRQMKRLMVLLSASQVGLNDDSARFTSDPSSNKLVGNDDDSMYLSNIFPNGCYSQYMTTMVCACCPQERLDYVLFSNLHNKPSTCTSYVERLKSDEPFSMNMNITTKRTISDLSDHYPLIAVLTFQVEQPKGNFTPIPKQTFNVMNKRNQILLSIAIVWFIIAIISARYR